MRSSLDQEAKITWFRRFSGRLALALLLGSGGVINSFAADTQAELPDKYVESGTITLCSSFTNPPREYREEGEPVGSDVELAIAMADSLGLKIQWLQLRFASLITSLQAGQCDMIVNELFITEERKKIIDFVPYSISGEQIVVHKDSDKNLESMDDLFGLKVALTEGTTFTRLVQEANEERKKEGKSLVDTLIVPSHHDMFNSVASGMADAAGATSSSSAYYIEKSSGVLIPAGKPFHTITNGFGIRQDSTLRDAMQSAFDQAVESGQYEEIFTRYGLASAMLPTAKKN